MAFPEDRFDPPFDKTQSVLDAKGGPKDLITVFRLLLITKRKAFWTPQAVRVDTLMI